MYFAQAFQVHCMCCTTRRQSTHISVEIMTDWALRIFGAMNALALGWIRADTCIVKCESPRPYSYNVYRTRAVSTVLVQYLPYSCNVYRTRAMSTVLVQCLPYSPRQTPPCFPPTWTSVCTMHHQEICHARISSCISLVWNSGIGVPVSSSVIIRRSIQDVYMLSLLRACITQVCVTVVSVEP